MAGNLRLISGARLISGKFPRVIFSRPGNLLTRHYRSLMGRRSSGAGGRDARLERG